MGAEISVDRFRGEQYYPSVEELKHRLESHYAKVGILAYLDEADASPEVLFHWPDTRRGSLSDVGILRHLIAGNIDIYPFDRRLLQSNGYDVRLGNKFYFHEDPDMSKETKEEGYIFPYYTRRVPFYNPVDPVNVRAAWGGPIRPQSAKVIYEHLGGSFEEDVKNKNVRSFKNINAEDKVIVITPTATFLGHSEEFIGGRNVVTTRISGKSTVGRNLIEVCSDANLGDIGFCNRWTLELTNKSHTSAVILPIGEPVATIQFEEIEVPIKQYEGRYQQGLSLEEIVDSWKPEMMLPTWRRFGK